MLNEWKVCAAKGKRTLTDEQVKQVKRLEKIGVKVEKVRRRKNGCWKGERPVKSKKQRPATKDPPVSSHGKRKCGDTDGSGDDDSGRKRIRLDESGDEVPEFDTSGQAAAGVRRVSIEAADPPRIGFVG